MPNRPLPMTRAGLLQQSFVLRNNQLGERVVNGALYTFAGILLRTTLTFGSMAILARLLTPADFGYIAMATVLTELAALFSNFGFSSVLIQRRVITRLHVDTVFWASTALGLLLGASIFLAAPLAETLYGEAVTKDILRFMSLPFIFAGMVVIHSAILTRLMRFKTIFLIDITAVVARILTAISMAFLGFGVWSLVAGSLTGSLILLISYLILVPYRPRLKFNARYIQRTWKTSSSYFGGGILFYLNSNIDLLLIGRTLGATSLGYYQNARSLTDEVRSRIAIPLQQVLFPAFSSIQDDRERLQRSIVRSGRLIALVIFPVGFGVSAVAEEIVPLLYGPQWLAMIPILKFLGFSAAIKGASAIATPIYNSLNRVGLALRVNLIGSIIMITAALSALPFGVEAVAAVIAATSLYAIVTLHIALRQVALGWTDQLHILGPAATCSALMWIFIVLIRLLLDGQELHPASQLPLLIAIGSFTYVSLLLLAWPSHVADMITAARSLLRRSVSN